MRNVVGVRPFGLGGAIFLSPFFDLLDAVDADVEDRCARRNACGANAAKMGAGKDSGGGAAVAVFDCCDPAGAGRFVPAVTIVG